METNSLSMELSERSLNFIDKLFVSLNRASGTVYKSIIPVVSSSMTGNLFSDSLC